VSDHCDDKERLTFGTLDNIPVVNTDLRLGHQIAVSYNNIREHQKASEFSGAKTIGLQGRSISIIYIKSYRKGNQDLSQCVRCLSSICLAYWGGIEYE
jgi:hypothetical protein